MTRVVFPSHEKLSYISHVVDSFEESKYLIVVTCHGQNIDSVDMVRNPYALDKKGFARFCRVNKFNTLISPDGNCLPLKKLKDKRVSVYKTKANKIVLNIFSDFIQDKLQKVC